MNVFCFIQDSLQRNHIKQAAKLENPSKFSTKQNRLSKFKELLYNVSSSLIYFFTEADLW